MRPTNRELAAEVFAALARRDIDAFLEFVHPDAEFTSLIAEAEGQTFRGHDGVREWWERVAESLGGIDFRMEEAEDRGDCVVAKIRVTGTIGDVPVSQGMYQVVWIRDGRARAWHFYRTRDEAIAAAEADG